MRWQSRGIFRVFMRAKPCSTRDTGAELFVEPVVCLAPFKEAFSLHALQSARLPGNGRLTTTTGRLSPSMTIW